MSKILFFKRAHEIKVRERAHDQHLYANCGYELKTRGQDTQIHDRYMRASVVNKSKEKQYDYLFT